MTMTNHSSLTTAFLEGQPKSAARELEDLDHGDAAALIETIPARLSAPVLGFMAPWAAARCVEALSVEKAATIVAAMAYRDATSVLRLVERDHLDRLLDAVKQDLAKDFRNSLTYPNGTVGAWMDITVPDFSDVTDVGDAIRYIKKRGSRSGSHIFVTDSSGAYIGLVSISTLLRSSASTSLSEILDPAVKPLSNRATLVSVATIPSWDEHPLLPVVGRRGNVLGGLSRSMLRKGMSEVPRVSTSFAFSSLWVHLFMSFLLVASNLLRVAAPRSHLVRTENEEAS